MENTSYISNMSYQIEVWLDHGEDEEYIKKSIEKMQGDKDFPSNLEYIDGYFDEELGSSGCAFLDTNTGEIIVGFAGTSDANGKSELYKDAKADVKLGAFGMNEESEYLYQANEFMNKLKNNGYNVTQITGHSLGGAIGVYIGVYYNIPKIVTYNGAPLHAFHLLNGMSNNGQAIKEKLKNYDGEIVRFVSNKDALNNLMYILDGYYAGKRYVIDDAGWHLVVNFLENDKQEYISSVISENKFFVDKVGKIDFDGDSNIDLSQTRDDLIIKNLFGNISKNSGNGTVIKINPEAFSTLNKNLQSSMAEGDISWINNAVKICNDKNDSIKDDKSQREDTLCSSIVQGLNEAYLTQLIGAIDESHGELSKDENRSVLRQLSEFDTYSVTRNFDSWGSSGGRTWYLDGKEFNVKHINYWVKNLKSGASDLYMQVVENDDFKQYASTSFVAPIYKFDVLSSIGESFVNTTNSFLSKAEEVFHGTGLRSGKNDGIVNAISEVLEVEIKNIDELKKQILNIAEIGQGIANNFDTADNWLTQEVQAGNFKPVALPESYTAYLEENNILDDVKDVLEAYDLQVEEASKKLAEYIRNDFEDLIIRTRNKLNVINDSLEDIRIPLEELSRIVNKTVTSTKTITNSVLSDVPFIEKIDSNHGTLANILPSNIANCIEHANTYILPHIYSIGNALYILDIYSSRISELKDYFAYIIEKAVYNSMELDTIISAQNLVTLRTGRMASEIEKVKSHIDAQYQGNSLEYYKTLLQSMVKSIEYFNLMIGDCFGKNSEQNSN